MHGAHLGKGGCWVVVECGLGSQIGLGSILGKLSGLIETIKDGVCEPAASEHSPLVLLETEFAFSVSWL